MKANKFSRAVGRMPRAFVSIIAALALLSAFGGWGCSGNGDNNSPGPAGSGGISGSAGSSGSSGGGIGGVSGSDAGDVGPADGAGGSSGSSGTSGSGGSQPDGGDADASKGGSGGSSGSAGDASTDPAAEDGGAGDVASEQSVESGGSGGASGSSGSSGSAGDAGDADVAQDVASEDGSAGSSGSGGTPSNDGGDADVYAEADSDGSSGSAGNDGGDAKDSTSEPPPPKPFKCSGWTRDLTFPSGLDLTGDIWGSGPNDIYVATGKYATGEMAHYDGQSWSLMMLPDVTGESWSHMISVWGANANDVWAGGNTRPQGKEPKPRLLRRLNSGSWSLDSSLPLVNGTDSFVRSIWGANSTDVFVLVDVNYGLASSWDAKIFRRNGDGSWTQMTLPPHAPPWKMNRIWGKSASEVYATGTRLDAQKNSIKGILWRYDGNGAWQSVDTLPPDVVQLIGVHGAGSEVWVVGYSWDGSKFHGVRLVSMDLTNWTRYDSPTTQVDTVVWSPWVGASLIGGSTGFPQEARVSIMSLGAWSDSPVGNGASYVTGVGVYPGSNSEVWLAIYGGPASVYKGNCQ